MSQSEVETARILERLRQGDLAAIDEVLRGHHDYLRRLIELHMHQNLRSRVDPSDVVQETQIELFRRVDALLQNRPTSIRLWLRRCALSRLKDLERRHLAAKRNVRRDVSLSQKSSLHLAERLMEGRPSQAMHRKEMARKVQEAIDRLAPMDRDIILMRYYEQLSNHEVAELLAIESATASKRFGRALQRLHAQLVDLGVSRP